MIISKRKFTALMNTAERNMLADRSECLYWQYYRMGLTRMVIGKSVVTDVEHSFYNSAKGDAAMGYRHGLLDGQKRRPGRVPEYGHTLPRVRVCKTTIESLQEICRRNNISLSDVRRQAYSWYIANNTK